MSGIYDWATPGNLQPEPITEEIWRNLPEELCRQVEVVNGQAIRCDSPSRAHQTAGRRLANMLESSADEYQSLSGDNVASIDVHVLDHAIGAYRLFRTLTPENELSTIEVPIRIKVEWKRLGNLVRWAATPYDQRRGCGRRLARSGQGSSRPAPDISAES